MSSDSAHDHAHDEHAHPGLLIQVEKKEGGLAAVKVEIAADELERARGREFAALSRRVAVKGFRPGKAPRAMLERQFQGEVDQHVIEHFMQHAYQAAIEEHKLRPAAYPRVNLGDKRPAKGEPWSLSFELILRPEVTLGEIEGLEVKGQPTAVTEEELERALVEIRRANSRAEPALDEGLALEGMAVATLDFIRRGEQESCLTRAGLRLTPQAPPQGVDKPTFQETLKGAKVGEQRSMEMEFPANFPLEEARGEKGTVRFTITEVLRIVPPSDEQIYKAFEVQDEAGLRGALRARMQTAKDEAEEQRIENELLERLIVEHPMDLPAQLVEDQVEAHQQELIEQLEKQGLSGEEAKTRAAEERERSRVSAEKALRAVYLIEEIARAKELRVTQEDISGELTTIAARNGTQVTDVANYYKEQGLLRQLGLELLERKVRRYLRASAAIRPPA